VKAGCALPFAFVPGRNLHINRNWYAYCVSSKISARVPFSAAKEHAMSALSALTLFHTLISLVAIVSGIPVVYGFLKSQVHAGWTRTYIIATGLTLITSFLFPFNGFTPAIGVGILCVLIFLPTVYAKYRTSLRGIWRLVYVAGSTALLYFNCFVLIAQSFQKVPFLHPLAPTGAEPPFAIAQAILLVAAIAIGFFAVRRFRLAGPALKVVR
jgi:hypothetical protein